MPDTDRIPERVWPYGSIPAIVAILSMGFVVFVHSRAAFAGETPPPGAPTDRVFARYAALPLRFEENRGQFDPSVKYAAIDARGAVFITPTEAVVSLKGHGAAPSRAVRMTFAGGTGAKSIAAEGPIETRSNYYVGADPAAWRLGVPSYSGVRGRDVYPGIDVVYRGTGQRLEYDFIVAPGANPADIRLEFEGADALAIERTGDLILRTTAGDVRQHEPVAYQDIDGRRHFVTARYVRRGRRGVAIALAQYDHRRPIIVDPIVVLHASYLGGGLSDKALALAADAAGNTYVAGLTESVDFPTVGAAQPSSGGTTDAFVAKLDASGTALLYATYLGGSAIDAALGIARGAVGSVYVAGYTGSPNFPTTPNPLQGNPGGGAYDAFVAKLGPTGLLEYSTYIGGSDVDIANAIAVDGGGNAYIAGFTCSPDFPVVNAFQPALNGAPYGCFAGWDAFVSKLDASGVQLAYSTYFGGSSKDEAKGIAVDAFGRASITGYTWSSDLPTAGVPLAGYRGSADPFVSRLDAAGGLDYSSWFGGTDHDEGSSIAVDAAGTLYVAGFTQSVDFPTAHAFQTDLHGIEDGFVFKLAISPVVSPSASLVYSSYLGGRSEERARAIAADSNGNAYVAGFTGSLDFPLASPAQAMLRGGQDAFLARISPIGSLAYSTYFGGNDDDDGWGVALSNGPLRGIMSMHIAGTTWSTDLATAGSFQQGPQGALDGFVAKLGYVP